MFITKYLIFINVNNCLLDLPQPLGYNNFGANVSSYQ